MKNSFLKRIFHGFILIDLIVKLNVDIFFSKTFFIQLEISEKELRNFRLI